MIQQVQGFVVSEPSGPTNHAELLARRADDLDPRPLVVLADLVPVDRKPSGEFLNPGCCLSRWMACSASSLVAYTPMNFTSSIIGKRMLVPHNEEVTHRASV